MTHITTKDIAKAALKVIDKRGNDFAYRHQACSYSTDGGATGSCLFGAALIDELGIQYDPYWEGQSIGDLVFGLVDEDSVGSNAVGILSAVQISQDGGRLYGALRGRLELVANS